MEISRGMKAPITVDNVKACLSLSKGESWKLNRLECLKLGARLLQDTEYGLCASAAGNRVRLCLRL